MLYSLRFTHNNFFHWNSMDKNFTWSYLSHHVIFYLLVYMCIYFILCTFMFFVSSFLFERVYIWFSKELIFLCGQKSAGFYPKLEVVFHHWQSVACEVCHTGHLLYGFQMEIINSVGINSYLVEMDHKLSQKRYICKPGSKVAVVYMPAIYTDFFLCAISRYHRNCNNTRHRERQSSFIKKGSH